MLDTNVLVSGIFFTGAPFDILRAWRHGRFRLCLNPEIALEYEAVLDRLREQFPTVNAQQVLALIVSHADVIATPALDHAVSADPDDDKFIACALAAGASFLVSGDRHLLEVGEYRGVRIVKPRAFLDHHVTWPGGDSSVP